MKMRQFSALARIFIDFLNVSVLSDTVIIAPYKRELH